MTQSFSVIQQTVIQKERERENMAPAAIQTGKQQANSSFQATLDGIRSAFNRSDGMVDVDELWRVLESYKSSPKDWSEFAFYEAHKYIRGLVDEDERYNVMVMGWGPSTKSCIHDHSGSHCFMKVSCSLFRAWPINL